MNEDEIINYLENNPEFIHKIQLSFSKGQTSSMVEKRIANLTDENNLLKKTAKENLTVSKENVILSQRVHLFTLQMIKLNGFEPFINYLLGDFLTLFAFDEVSIFSDEKTNNDKIQSLTDKTKLKPFSECNKIYYGTKQQYHLSSICNDGIESVAIINIGCNAVKFLILIGSKNINRFTPDKDPFFISNIKQIMDSKLDGFNQ